MNKREIVFVVYPGVQTLDVTGPYDVFAAANQMLAATGSTQPVYGLRIVASSTEPVRSSSGLAMLVDGDLGVLDGATIDTLLVAGGFGVREAIKDEQLVAAVRTAATSSRRVASVCTGAFLLAEAGLLDGRSVTTHWVACDELARRYPQVSVDAEPIYTRDGQIYTSAGVTAGMDLSLALVEEDLGRDVALTVARYLVMFLRRPANQAQFSEQLQAQLSNHDGLRELQSWIIEHPDADLSVEALAQRAVMSPRHFARTFTRELHTTPGRYVERVRVEAARRALEDTSAAIEQIARECGFGTAETMRRTFIRALGVAPSEYRRRFAVAA